MKIDTSFLILDIIQHVFGKPLQYVSRKLVRCNVGQVRRVNDQWGPIGFRSAAMAKSSCLNGIITSLKYGGCKVLSWLINLICRYMNRHRKNLLPPFNLFQFQVC